MKERMKEGKKEKLKNATLSTTLRLVVSLYVYVILSVLVKKIMKSVDRPSVVMLNVVAPIIKDKFSDRPYRWQYWPGMLQVSNIQNSFPVVFYEFS